MKAFYLICIFFLLGFSLPTIQNDDLSKVKVALKSSSSKELLKFMDERVDLNFDNNNSNYSKTQAEFVLKDFFKKYPAKDFQYIHQGGSREGLVYAIGKYSHSSGSFRVLIRAREHQNTYSIYSMDFSKE
ncbi:MAG: DUF4783 domain-containing protein [Cyclobacteriaceae bacterium]|nr:DUF4783 domain-containing protein [Cyclobacteriaceae bacterium]MCH8515591.1 DUF4783 domain-containing protein [Cyclobacteriaceae bacterium]